MEITIYQPLRKVKQEAILLVDELFANAKYDTSGHPKHPHGWLDNNGNNDYDYWKVYVQEKIKPFGRQFF